MAHSVELLFDDETDSAIRRLWDALAAAGLASQSRVASATNRPHVTCAVADHIDSGVDAPLRLLASRLPLPCLIGAPLLFGNFSAGRGTLARLIVPSAELLSLQRAGHDICLPHMTPGAPRTGLAHGVPGRWTPHATLSRRLGVTDVGPALAALEGLGQDLAGHFVGLRRWDGDQRIEHPLS